jgi:multiple sugar transport system substrate-binding protein
MKQTKLSRRDFLRLSATSALGMAALAACSPAASPQPAQPTSGQAADQATQAPAPTTAPPSAQGIKIVHWDPSHTDTEIVALDKGYLGFNTAQSAYQVEVVHGKDEDAVLPAVAAGNPPDSFWRWNAVTYGSWINKKIIMDVTPYIQSSKLDLKRIVPAALKDLQWKGKYYGMPLTSAGIGLFYWNKPWAQKVGLDPEKAPQTLDEVVEMTDKLTTKDASGNITGLGFHWNFGAVEWSLLYNADFWDGTSKLTPTEPAIVSAFQWVADFYKHVGIDAMDRFIAGFPTGGYYGNAHPMCHDLVGEFAGFEWDFLFMTTVAGCTADKYGMAKMPPAPGHPEYPTCTQGTIALVIPTGAGHPDGAWQFFEYMQGVESSGVICTGLINCSQLLDAGNYKPYAENPVLKLATDLSSNSKAFPGYIPVAAEYSTELGKAFDLVIHGKETAEKALQAVYDQVQPQLDTALQA